MGGFSRFLPQLIPPNRRREAGKTLEDLQAPDITKLLTPPSALENIRGGIASPIEKLLSQLGLGGGGGGFGAVGGPTGGGTPPIVGGGGGGSAAGSIANLAATIPLLLAAKNNPAIAGGFTRQGNITAQQGLERQRDVLGEIQSRRRAGTAERGQDIQAELEREAETGRTGRFETTQQTERERFDADLKNRRTEADVLHRRNLRLADREDELARQRFLDAEDLRHRNALSRMDKEQELGKDLSISQIIKASEDQFGNIDPVKFDLILQLSENGAEIEKKFAAMEDAARAAEFTDQVMELLINKAPNVPLSGDEITQLVTIRRQVFLSDLPEAEKANILKMIDPQIEAAESEAASPQQGVGPRLLDLLRQDQGRQNPEAERIAGLGF